MLFFALVYVVEGIGQTGGLIAQPLNFYLKQTFGWTPVQVTAYLTILNLPWIIKPVYGIVSDFLPLFGYRRKAYLVLANAAAAVAYCWVTQITAPSQLIFVLLLTAYAMAVSSTLCGAILVENGQRFGASDTFVNQQWLWFNIAALASGFIGGQLVERLSPSAALHAAAGVIAVAPLAVVFAGWFLITEPKSRIDLPEMKRTFASLLAAFTLRELWIVSAFLFLYYLNPGFGTPLYYHMTDNLKFSQEYIGILGSISAAGWIVGALLYRRFLKGITARALLNWNILFGTVTTAAFLFLWDEATAAVINFFSGTAGMIAFVATLTLAADYCPRRSEGFAFAALMSITNFSAALSDNIGSFLYEHLFERHLDPLILVSAAFTALAFAFVPLLRLRDKRPGEPARALVTGDGSGHAWPGFAWAGNTQEHQNSTIQSDNVPVGETADLAAASGPSNGRNLVDHQAAGGPQSVFRTRLDDQVKQWGVGRIGGEGADRDRVGPTEAVILESYDRSGFAYIAPRRQQRSRSHHVSSAGPIRNHFDEVLILLGVQTMGDGKRLAMRLDCEVGGTHIRHPNLGRVGMWRGGGRPGMSVAAPFV